ncbi:hypothetical protein [Mongoliibacter ruber]|uniref:Uncharacterized protein n=1 Tax=Mongoliibacter ruber TaxID=1750599 RepID=A0A2T0WB76_9BACT|nr:hypothetical protein [Mongoliibacter ruber]PRY83784.1 hypothetical protein CLW00_1251 [Mongoliibacter ruber]
MLAWLGLLTILLLLFLVMTKKMAAVVALILVPPVLCGYSLGEIYCVGFQYFIHSIFVVLGVSVYF